MHIRDNGARFLKHLHPNVVEAYSKWVDSLGADERAVVVDMDTMGSYTRYELTGHLEDCNGIGLQFMQRLYGCTYQHLTPEEKEHSLRDPEYFAQHVIGRLSRKTSADK